MQYQRARKNAAIRHNSAKRDHRCLAESGGGNKANTGQCHNPPTSK